MFKKNKCIKFKIYEITLPSLHSSDLNLDTLWHPLCFNRKIDSESCPGWSGYVLMVSSE